jgi:conflict system STAND superfamily ATPase
MPPTRSIEEKIKIGTGSIVAIVGFVTVLLQLLDGITKFRQKARLPDIIDERFVFFFILIGLGVWLLINGLSRRSRLLLPEHLIIRNDKPEHLKGRNDDISAVSNLCHQWPVVGLVGESGVGKTALLRAGLGPTLKVEGFFHPIYVGGWGGDWEDGPCVAVTNALWQSLTQEHRVRFGFTGAPECQKLCDMLQRFWDEIGRKPLLIFDEFHDYTFTQRAKLFDDVVGCWLSSDDLTRQNTFWRTIAELVRKDLVHVLFATRIGDSDSLHSVQFYGQQQLYPLDRLSPEFVRSLLNELTTAEDDSKPIISDPDRGWEKLKERIVRDLTQEGTVLPIRLKAVLQGLAGLTPLTVQRYKQVGALQGLEVLFVERRVEAAARVAELEPGQMRSALLALIQPGTTSSSMPKTSAQPISVLVDSVLAGDPNAEAVARLSTSLEAGLSNLKRYDLTREQRSHGTRDRLWALYHDYFCKCVLESERRADRWNALLSKRYRDFQQAKNHYLSLWHSLLSPRELALLLYQRLRGRLYFGSQRRYAMFSALRLLPYLLIPFLLLLLADVGAPVPGGARIRTGLDTLGLTLFRSVAPLHEIQARAMTLRRECLAELKARRTNSGWIQGVGGPGEARDTWTQPQSLSAIYRAPEESEFRLFRDDLYLMFAPDVRVDRDVNGQRMNFGWPGPNYAQAEPLLWTVTALAELKRQSLIRPDRLQAWNESYAYVQRVAPLFRNPETGGWNTLALQADQKQHSTYTAALALLTLLEVRAANLPWEGSVERREALINATAEWLIKNYDTTTQMPGWRANETEDVSDGLTLQIYGVLLRAEEEAGVRLPQAILDGIPRRLEGVVTRDMDYQVDTGSFDLKRTNLMDGQVGPQEVPVTFLWHPWAIDCAYRWMLRLQKNDASRADLTATRRVLSHLVMDLGEPALAVAKKLPTFRTAETLYGLSSLALHD